jgi:uncharacterized protein YbjT (DUF2867 family)
MGKQILLTGATGFVGRRVYPRLVERGHRVRCGTRRPDEARRRHPDRTWIELDVHRPELVDAALRDVEVVYYLVHEMAAGPGYRERELQAARTLIRAAERAGVERIVYLGGVRPAGTPSEHLDSRLRTGAVLRSGAVPCLELRAAMIVGVGSASWKICRDLATRLPLMLLPTWLSTRSQPVAIDDVVAALVEAATVECTRSMVYDLPGPETLSAKEILLRIARLRGTEPRTLGVPVLTPRLSSYWLKWVTGADYGIARELVEGLRTDLISTQPAFWDRLPEHRLIPFDEAARVALGDEPVGSRRSRALEALAFRFSKHRAGR